MGDTKSEKTDNLFEINDNWSQCLRCTICFCTLRDPHTLDCGHTFCKRCLKRLADIERADNPDIRRKILILVCPTCRRPFPAKPTLRGKTATNIVVKHMVEIWERECKMLLSSAFVSLRSLPTQTSPLPLTGGEHKEGLTDSNLEPIKISQEIENESNEPIIQNSIKTINQVKVQESGEGFEAVQKNTKNAKSKSLDTKTSKAKDIMKKTDSKRKKNERKEVKTNQDETSANIDNSPYFTTSEKTTKNIKDNNKEDRSKDIEESDDISCIVIEERMKPDNKYLEQLMKRIIDFYNDDDEDEPSQKAKVLTAPANNASPGGGGGGVPGHDSDTDASRSSSSNSNTEFTVNTHSDASLSDIFGRIAIPRISLTLRRDYSFGRLLLIGFWFLYTAVIVAIADSFMPYITIATFFTLLLFLG